MSGVYVIRNSVNGRIYIGSTICFKARWKVHRRDLRAGSHANKALQNAWDKYGESGFLFEIAVLAAKDDVIASEQSAIDDARARGIALYNIRPVAKNNSGLKLGPRPDAVKQKISTSRLGIKPWNDGVEWDASRRMSLTDDGRRRQGSPRANKTECPHGHVYSEKNTYIAKNGQRQCRECSRIRMLQKRTRDRMARGVEGTHVK